MIRKIFIFAAVCLLAACAVLPFGGTPWEKKSENGFEAYSIKLNDGAMCIVAVDESSLQYIANSPLSGKDVFLEVGDISSAGEKHIVAKLLFERREGDTLYNVLLIPVSEKPEHLVFEKQCVKYTGSLPSNVQKKFKGKFGIRE